MAIVHENRDSERLDEHVAPPFLRRVRIRGYKSIAFCDVQLRPLTVLVGRNGSGKSNFLDALAFLQDASYWWFARAVGSPGGFQSLLFLGADEPRTITFELTLEFIDGRHAEYGLEIGDPRTRNGRYREREWLRVAD